MNKYFIQLFLKENTIILPGFGALTAPNGSLEEIMFLPYLKFDDGKLADFIVETEGVNHQDAQNTIAKFIREMEVSLNKGESFDIYNFGSFFKNEDGEIEFKSSLKDRAETPTAAPDVQEEKQSEPIIELNTTQEILEAEIKPSEETPVLKSEEIKSEKEALIFHPATPASTSETTPIVEPLTENKKGKTAENQSPKPLPTKDEPIKEKKKRKLGVAFWLLTLLALGAIAGGIYYINFFKKDKPTEKAIAKTEEATLQKDSIEKTDNTARSKEEPIETKIPKTENEVKEVVKPPVTPQNTTSSATILPKDAKGFFIIGGVYPSMASVEKKLKSVAEEGISAKILPQNNGQMYLSLADFKTRAEATKGLKAIRDKGFKAWLLVK